MPSIHSPARWRIHYDAVLLWKYKAQTSVERQFDFLEVGISASNAFAPLRVIMGSLDCSETICATSWLGLSPS